ncbi:MAG: type II toxin-antitoxin system RelE/ParE family toxin [archaeon]
MAKYNLKEMDKFGKLFNKLPSNIKFHFEKQFRKLEENPYALGKPLGCGWFQELKHGIYRVYYLIYDEETVVLLADISNKKTQQKVIFSIKNKFFFFKEYIKGKYYKEGGLHE